MASVILSRLRSFVPLFLIAYAIGAGMGWSIPSCEASTDPQNSTLSILFLGDSLTEGYGVPKEKAYPHLVIEQLNHRLVTRRFGVRVSGINGGSSGSTSASGVSRLKWYLKLKPKVLFLALGANDGLRGLSIVEMEKNLDETLKLAQANGMRLVIAGMKLPPNYGTKAGEQFEQVFHRLAKKYRAVEVPFLLAEVGGEKDLNLEDGIHPNEAGHEKIAKWIFPALEKVVTENK